MNVNSYTRKWHSNWYNTYMLYMDVYFYYSNNFKLVDTYFIKQFRMTIQPKYYIVYDYYFNPG